LQPGAFDQRRDLALVAMKTNRAGMAIDLLQGCLKDTDEDKERLVITQYLHTAEQLLSVWN
jgi:hypothetical protein